MTYRSQIVGMHFRPPAKVWLAHLAAGTPLRLAKEVDNPYDEFAIQVLVEPGLVPQSELDGLREECFMMGQDMDEIMLRGEALHLGYLISANNKKLGAWTPNTVVWTIINDDLIEGVELAFDEQGVAYARIEAKEPV